MSLFGTESWWGGRPTHHHYHPNSYYNNDPLQQQQALWQQQQVPQALWQQQQQVPGQQPLQVLWQQPQGQSYQLVQAQVPGSGTVQANPLPPSAMNLAQYNQKYTSVCRGKGPSGAPSQMLKVDFEMEILDICLRMEKGQIMANSSTKQEQLQFLMQVSARILGLLQQEPSLQAAVTAARNNQSTELPTSPAMNFNDVWANLLAIYINEHNENVWAFFMELLDKIDLWIQVLVAITSPSTMVQQQDPKLTEAQNVVSARRQQLKSKASLTRTWRR